MSPPSNEWRYISFILSFYSVRIHPTLRFSHFLIGCSHCSVLCSYTAPLCYSLCPKPTACFNLSLHPLVWMLESTVCLHVKKTVARLTMTEIYIIQMQASKLLATYQGQCVKLDELFKPAFILNHLYAPQCNIKTLVFFTYQTKIWCSCG